MKTKLTNGHLRMEKERSYPLVNEILPNSVPTSYSKGAVKRLFEIVRKENPEICIVSRPTTHVQNGKNRHKFPDPKKDCCIKLAINCRSSKLALPVSYFDCESDEYSFTGGLRYAVQVTAVRRFTSEGGDEPSDDLYCHCPLNQHKAGMKTRSLGFWFRFFGQPAKFVVTISLKLLGVNKLTKLLRRTKEYRNIAFSEGNDWLHVCSVDVNISNIAFQQNTSKSKNRVLSKRPSQQAPLLYTDKSYQETMNNIWELRRRGQYTELESYLESALSSTSDCDIRTVIVLEQSIEMCRKGILIKAKLRIKDAVDYSSKCKNKALLMGRSYLYLSQVHEADCSFGSAQECLEIARKKLEVFQPCEDVGDLCFQEGIVLMKFAKMMSKLASKLQQEAILKFNEALMHYNKGLCVTATNVTQKLLSTHAWLAVSALHSMPNVDSSSVDTDSVVENALVKLRQNFDKLSVRIKYLYYLCQAENHCRHSRFEEASVCLDEAISIGDAQCINLEPLWSASLRQTIINNIWTSENENYTENNMDCLTKWTAGRDDGGYLGDSNS